MLYLLCTWWHTRKTYRNEREQKLGKMIIIRHFTLWMFALWWQKENDFRHRVRLIVDEKGGHNGLFECVTAFQSFTIQCRDIQINKLSGSKAHLTGWATSPPQKKNNCNKFVAHEMQTKPCYFSCLYCNLFSALLFSCHCKYMNYMRVFFAHSQSLFSSFSIFFACVSFWPSFFLWNSSKQNECAQV